MKNIYVVKTLKKQTLKKQKFKKNIKFYTEQLIHLILLFFFVKPIFYNLIFISSMLLLVLTKNLILIYLYLNILNNYKIQIR